MIEPSSSNDQKKEDQTEYKSSPLKEDTGSTRNLSPKNDGDETQHEENRNSVASNEGDNQQRDRSGERRTPADRNDGDNENTEKVNSEEYMPGNHGDNGEDSNPEIESYRDNKSDQSTSAVKGLEQIYSKHKTGGKSVQGRRKNNTPNNPSSPKVRKQRYGLTKHELKSLINDDQAIEMKQRYGNNRVVLDFSKGNDDAKIIVYDDKHASIEKRNKIRKVHDSPVHSLASKGTENQFIGRLQKERAEYRAKNGLNGTAKKTRSKLKSSKKTRLGKKTKKGDKKSSKKTIKKIIQAVQSSNKLIQPSNKLIQSGKKTINKSKANVNLTKEVVQDVTSSKRGMMMTQYDKQECGLLSKHKFY